MESMVEKVGMPMDEFIRLYNDQPFEIMDGERVVKMPNVSRHDEATRAIFVPLYLFGKERQLGEAMTESPFVLSYTSNWVTGSRTPDVMYYTWERIKAYKQADPNYGDKPYILVPDLAVEVVSPNDNLADLGEKVEQYLLDGVQIVWVFDPQKRTAAIHTLTARQPFTKQQITLKADDILSGGDLIPGFEIKVASVFE
jgi:Uma2 family endonuclease